MRHPTDRVLRRSALLVAAMLALVWASAAAAGTDGKPSDRLAFMDSRHAPAAQQALNARAAKLTADTPAATAALKDSLGVEGFVKLDPLTATASFVGKTNGFLTGPSAAPAGVVGLDYVKANAAALGLTANGVATLELSRDYVDILGTHHLSYVQKVNGVMVFGNGVKVNVAKDGRIINVTGSPVASLAGAPAATPGISAAQAVLAAKQNVGAAAAPAATTSNDDLTTNFSSGDATKLVYFKTLNGLTLAYRTLLVNDGYLIVVDAASGKVLYRDSFKDSANGLAFDNRPGAAAGGTQHSFDVNGPGGSWNFGAFNPLVGTDAGLSSNNVWVYSDINDSNGASVSELIRNDGTGNFNYAFTPFTNTANSPCSMAYPCSWNSHFPDGAFSWDTNRKQNGTQVYFFVNTYHDHLLAAPIGFTEAAGNFQLVNSTGQGEAGDPVLAESDDGANTQRFTSGTLTGMPDGNHIDNANFNTPPDGFLPRTQMYLFNWPFAPDAFLQVNGGDEGSVVYHEYTHGLSNRLVVDADGNSTLGNIQAGSMGEAWSDWYAEDFLVNQGFVTDNPGVADVLEGDYVSGGDDLIRTEPLDCKVGSSDAACDGDPDGTAGTGGYTYGDFGKIIGRPEVHADGEIWSQTLWDLRDALGSNKVEGIVTRAMELAPSNPSYLDMRNSILQADLVANGGANHDTIWSTFAHRGMGYFAGAVDGDDAFPVESSALPPTSKKFGQLHGKVVDADTNLPIVGASVLFGGHASGFPDDIAGITDEFGVYHINKILVGTYPKVWATAPGYDRQVLASVVIPASAVKIDWKLRRNWASLAGGGSIDSFTGPNYGPQCPPEGAIDDSAGVGWGSDTDNGTSTGNVTPKNIVVKLPQAVNITQMFVDPSNTCGDPGSSSTRGYRIQTSTDGTTFTTVNQGVFYSGNRNRLNDVGALSGGPVNAVRYIKFWILNPQVPNAASGSCNDAATCGSDPDDNSNVAAHCGPGKDNGFGGCTFMDMVELKVYGRPA